MNYRHAFHAGNFADVHKHWILCLLIERLTAKEKPAFFLDTHAGAGFYDLFRDESARTGEAAEGIARIWGDQSAETIPGLDFYLNKIKALNPDGTLRWYPGSPWLMGTSLRAGDRLVAIEAHPDQARLLTEALMDVPAKVYQRDGYTALPSFVPPPERRGLVLVDPPYEQAEDVDNTLKAVRDAITRFETCTVLIWYPIKEKGIGDTLELNLPKVPRGGLRSEIWMRDPGSVERGLSGSGVIVLNPIWPVEDQIQNGTAPLLEKLSANPDAGWSLHRFDVAA